MPRIDNFHSEDVQDILGRAPSWVVRWGVTAVFAIFGGVLLGCYFIKYPDIIESPVEITTYNPPVDLIVRYDGLIDTLCVRDGAMVESGTLIAVLNNTSSFEDVEAVSQKLNQISSLSFDEAVSEPWINDQYTLGDLQASFANFQKSCRDYNHYIQTEHIKKKKELLEQQITKNREYYAKQKTQHRYIIRDLDLQANNYTRDSMLYQEGVISSANFEVSSQNLLQKKNSEAGFNASLTSTELQIVQNEQQLVELTIQQDNEMSEHRRGLTQNYQQLGAEIAKWRQLYTLVAPTTGRITFTNYWSENQHVKVGNKLASIVPQNESNVIGRIQIPSSGFGKVKVGQAVNVKLNGYPYMEFGVLKGTITSLSAVPEQIQTSAGVSIVYIAEVSFTQGLKTSYNKELPMIQQMNGTAEVITEDMRLISRFFYPIISLFKNR